MSDWSLQQLNRRDRRLFTSLQDASGTLPGGDDPVDLQPDVFSNLEREIARAKNPKVRNILVEEHNSLKERLFRMFPHLAQTGQLSPVEDTSPVTANPQMARQFDNIQGQRALLRVLQQLRGAR